MPEQLPPMLVPALSCLRHCSLIPVGNCTSLQAWRHRSRCQHNRPASKSPRTRYSAKGNTARVTCIAQTVGIRARKHRQGWDALGHRSRGLRNPSQSRTNPTPFDGAATIFMKMPKPAFLANQQPLHARSQPHPFSFNVLADVNTTILGMLHGVSRVAQVEQGEPVSRPTMSVRA